MSRCPSTAPCPNHPINGTLPITNGTLPVPIDQLQPGKPGKETPVAPVAPVAPVDLGVSPNKPYVPYTPHINPQIPKRPKCKPKNKGKDAAAGKAGKKLQERDVSLANFTPRNDMEKLEFYFGQRLMRNIDKLPAKANFEPTPWPSSYFPTHRDSINARWTRDELPAADKYAKAFGLNVAKFRESVSRHNGVLSQSGRKPCSSNQDCRGLNDGSVCSKRDGEARGFSECPITKNGVTFRPFDIKALVTLAWDGARAPTIFTGKRYNGPEDAPKDKFGRFTDAAYRDLNPGFFHIAMSNLLGRYRKSFVVDVTASAEVWNQPVRGFEVLEKTIMSPENAARRFYNTNTYPFNDKAKSIAFVKTKFTWIVEAGEDGALVSTGRVKEYMDSRDYTYLLELDGAHNIIGGEWIKESNGEHPDFLWFAAARPDINAVTKVGLTYRHVRELLDASANARC
ncbi:hypothetical protein BCR44DRAFT_1539952 [Catenaria anguillulae PL171]|uniref:Uncharacterized protein n=1 Tax=Catenaria anguillulae PL171 TaxID=765915 RepID=A0A1Y2HXB3_9FUNG|nr:hypothetical protein BCR44DRAFT_1539952 [Catenaria anguillulae PL171]